MNNGISNFLNEKRIHRDSPWLERSQFQQHHACAVGTISNKHTLLQSICCEPKKTILHAVNELFSFLLNFN